VGANVAVDLFAWFRDRVEAKGARHGLVYPWWIPVASTTGLVAGALGGAVQRADAAPVWVLVVAVVLTGGPCIAHFVIRPWMAWWLDLGFALVGVGILLSYPFPVDGSIDFAPIALAFAVGEVTATDGARRGLFAVATSAALLLAMGDYDSDLSTLFVAELFVGLFFGYMLRWQMRALAAEQAARHEERVRATLAERQRVAREIHDLVAHSLSVTMLHVTGARRALEQDADVPDAIEALTEAERIGRQAMTDIRRTVGVLREEHHESRTLPGAGDVDALVADFRGAGLEVDWRATGDVSRLSPSAGLGVYRVVQESLANVVKHAPGAPAVVRLDVGRADAHLTIANPVLAGAVVGTDGSGVAGMTSRVDQLGGELSVGVDGEHWRVHLTVPLETT
jgi:signal transduction histidine kinase